LKSLTSLMQCVLDDLGTRCGTSTTQDYKTILRRVEHEGLSFLTITLSDFGKDFEKSLDQGRVAPNQFAAFSRAGGLPRFLGGFLELVFDRETGRLLAHPSVDAIRAVRQVTLMFGKIALDCTPERVSRAIDGYVKCEQDVRWYDSTFVSESNRFKDFGRVGRLLWADFFSSVDSRVYNESVMPKHGPGATADKLRGNAKYNQRTWTRRLEEVFPHWEHLIPSESALQRTDGVTILEPGEEMPVRVITVPKTLKTPRIIAVEPTCMQYMQQGVLSVMVEEMARFDNTRHFVRFESQEPNQRLAREGSLQGTLATLDLSEASDRVSNQHVRLLLANHRWFRSAVDATRSRKADVPGHGVLRLAKFASMGSALCFPFEALVFTTVIFCGIEQALNRRLSKRDIQSFYGKVRVYGDDIIVPVEYVQSVVSALEAFGFRVNANKSFWTGRFRESCGKDYYAGHDVSVVRVRHLLPTRRLDATEVISAVSLRNQLFHAGLEKAVAYLDDLISSLIKFPIVEWGVDDHGNPCQSSPLLGRHAYTGCTPERHDKALQRPLVKGYVVHSELPINRLDDYGALMKWFLKEGELPFQNKDHLVRSGRPRSVRIKARWADPRYYSGSVVG